MITLQSLQREDFIWGARYPTHLQVHPSVSRPLLLTPHILRASRSFLSSTHPHHRCNSEHHYRVHVHLLSWTVGAMTLYLLCGAEAMATVGAGETRGRDDGCCESTLSTTHDDYSLKTRYLDIKQNRKQVKEVVQNNTRH